MARSAILNVMVGAATKAGRRLVRDYGEVENLQVSVKGPNDFVTNADRTAEKLIFEELSRARPDYGFLMEESEPIEGKDAQHRFIVDPLDGTMNFLHSNPIFAISIGLERQGEMVAGVIYNPILDELFTAERGQGAFFNDRRIRVAGRRKITEGAYSLNLPHVGWSQHGPGLRRLHALSSSGAAVRATGSCAIDLAWTAAGRFDGCCVVGIKPWDAAAGMIIVREAGGFVSDLEGSPDVFGSGSVVAGNEQIHRQMIETLAKAA